MLIKSISSSENREAGAETSGLSMLIKSTSSVEMTNIETLVKSHSKKETKPSTAIEEEPPAAKPPQESRIIFFSSVLISHRRKYTTRED